MKNLYFILIFAITSKAEDDCKEYTIPLKFSGYSKIENDANGDMSLSPDKSIWTTDRKNYLYILNVGGGAPERTIKLDGIAYAAPIFMGKTPSSNGLVGTNNGWINVVRQDGSIVFKKQVIKNSGFSKPAFPLGSDEHGLLAENGTIVRVSNTGKFLEDETEKINRNLKEAKPASQAACFKNKSIAYTIYDPNDDSEAGYKTRVVTADGKVIEYRPENSQAVNHAPGIGLVNGKEVGIFFGVKGQIRIVDENAKQILVKYLDCYQQGGFAKLNDTEFVSSCTDPKTGTSKLIKISATGVVTKILNLPSTPSSDFSIVENPITKRINVVAGLFNGQVIVIDPSTKSTVSSWTDQDKFSGLMAAKPTITEHGLVVKRDQDIVTLDWQIGSSSNQQIKTGEKDCGKAKVMSLGLTDDHSS